MITLEVKENGVELITGNTKYLVIDFATKFYKIKDTYRQHCQLCLIIHNILFRCDVEHNVNYNDGRESLLYCKSGSGTLTLAKCSTNDELILSANNTAFDEAFGLWPVSIFVLEKVELDK